MSAAIYEAVRLFVITSALLALAVFATIAVRDWRSARRARKAAEEAARQEAQKRAWWAFAAAMHAAQGGTPLPYPGDER